MLAFCLHTRASDSERTSDGRRTYEKSAPEEGAGVAHGRGTSSKEAGNTREDGDHDHERSRRANIPKSGQSRAATQTRRTDTRVTVQWVAV